MLRAIDHVQIAIPVGGEARARPFYGELLGLTEVPKPAELAKRGGCWFEAGAIKVHLGVEEDFRAARKAHVAFEVEDVAGLAARAAAAGYETKTDDDLEGYERVFIYDPFGNRLEFLKPELPGFRPTAPADPAAHKAALGAIKRAFPIDYYSFLAKHDGGEGFIDDHYVIVDGPALAKGTNDAHAKFGAPIWIIGSDGGGEAFGLDLRDGRWPQIVMAPFIGMDDEDCWITAALSFAELLAGNFTDEFRSSCSENKAE